MMRYARPLITLLALLVALPAFGQPQLAPYRIVRTIAIGAPDRWDYVVFEPVQNQVYVAHGDTVTIVDAKADRVIGTLTIGGATHGIAALPALGKGYADDGKAGVTVVFDLKTFKELRRIKTEPDSDGIVYDPASDHVLVITGGSGKVDVIDPRTDNVIARIDGGGPLEFGVLGENGKFYVDGEDKDEIVRMDLGTNNADAHWPLAGCHAPHGLAIDRAHMRLFASCGNRAMDVVDARTGKVLATLPIGEGTDFAEFDTARGLALSSNRDGTISIVKEETPNSFKVLPPIVTMPGGRTMALDQRGGRLYVVASDTTINNAVPADGRAHYKIMPGSAKLLVLEAAH